MHPLPRVEELGYDLDNDERAVYFKQAAYGVPVRMALIAALLRIRPDLLGQGPPAKKHRVYTEGTLGCENTRCVTGLSSEQRYLEPRFLIIQEAERLLARCFYCEHDMIPEFVGRQSTRKFEPNRRAFAAIPDDLLLFADEEAALRRGCSPVRQKAGG
jgi:hypothetical protein